MLEGAVNMPPWYSCSGVTMGLAVLATYVGLLQLLRFRRVRGLKLMDVKTDPSAVYRETAMLEFPFTVSKALEFAQFRAFGVPSISKLLHKTGEFCKRAGKRYDDTDLLFREFWENDTDTNRSKISVARINAIHGLYSKQISNSDMLYTLCLFITEPAAWIDRYEWRHCTDIEKEGLLGHFALLGERMGIKGSRDWKTWDDALAFQLAYEAEHFQYHESNNAVAVSTLDLFISNVPTSFQWAARWAVYALMDPFLLKTMGLPQVPTLLNWAVTGALLLRAMIVRFLLPPRPEFLVSRRTPVADDATITPQCCMKPRYEYYADPKLSCMLYKDGYRIGDLGTSSCPAGRLMYGVPTFTGHGGGGSGVAAADAVDDAPTASTDAAAAAAAAAREKEE